jgi:hypothetical protein
MRATPDGGRDLPQNAGLVSHLLGPPLTKCPLSRAERQRPMAGDGTTKTARKPNPVR